MVITNKSGHQEFSSRALVTVVPIMFLLLGPLALVLVCVGYRVFVKTKKAQAQKRGSSRRESRELLEVRPVNDDIGDAAADDGPEGIAEGHQPQRETEIN